MLGILNLIACISLVVYGWYSGYLYDGMVFAWGFPVLLCTIATLVCGIWTIKRRQARWGYIGLIAASVAWGYMLFISWLYSGY